MIMVKSKFLEKYKEEIRAAEKEVDESIDKIHKEIRTIEGGEILVQENRGRPKGSGPSLEDSGGWCLHENKTVTTIKNRVTGTKTVHINGLEVSQR